MDPWGLAELAWQWLTDLFKGASPLPFPFFQQIKAVERYMRRLEFHISKVMSSLLSSFFCICSYIIEETNPWPPATPLCWGGHSQIGWFFHDRLVVRAKERVST